MNGNVGGEGKEAFKITSKVVNERQEVSKNDLLHLGGGIEPKASGKYLDKNHINLKPTKVENMYPVQQDLNMMVRRNVDEYPEYVKNKTGQSSFTRLIETAGRSKQKQINETDYNQKTSAVHLSSIMKSKSNGKSLYSDFFTDLIFLYSSSAQYL